MLLWLTVIVMKVIGKVFGLKERELDIFEFGTILAICIQVKEFLYDGNIGR